MDLEGPKNAVSLFLTEQTKITHLWRQIVLNLTTDALRYVHGGFLKLRGKKSGFQWDFPHIDLPLDLKKSFEADSLTNCECVGDGRRYSFK